MTIKKHIERQFRSGDCNQRRWSNILLYQATSKKRLLETTAMSHCHIQWNLRSLIVDKVFLFSKLLPHAGVYTHTKWKDSNLQVFCRHQEGMVISSIKHDLISNNPIRCKLHNIAQLQVHAYRNQSHVQVWTKSAETKREVHWCNWA